MKINSAWSLLIAILMVVTIYFLIISFMNIKGELTGSIAVAVFPLALIVMPTLLGIITDKRVKAWNVIGHALYIMAIISGLLCVLAPGLVDPETATNAKLIW